MHHMRHMHHMLSLLRPLSDRSQARRRRAAGRPGWLRRWSLGSVCATCGLHFVVVGVVVNVVVLFSLFLLSFVIFVFFALFLFSFLSFGSCLQHSAPPHPSGAITPVHQGWPALRRWSPRTSRTATGLTAGRCARPPKRCPPVSNLPACHLFGGALSSGTRLHPRLEQAGPKEMVTPVHSTCMSSLCSRSSAGPCKLGCP